ncbi:hypothetical protein TrCOL_g11925 [Triparma columacea]|uniref:Uncharacterized protein n=1 Tax=Triparma columacea TaxID=722753 RepID=A0A9W7GJ98_9STRA|nr:hypothetical protein TrCOL_g11925 [Triparma columacea]
MAQAPPPPKAALSPLPRVSFGSTSASTYSTSEGFEIVIDSDSDDEKAAASNKRKAEEEAAPVAAKASKAEADSSPAESPAPVTAPVAALPTLTVTAPLLPPVAAPVPRVIAPVSPATCHNEEQGLPPPRSKFHQWHYRHNAEKVSPSDHGLPPSVTIYRGTEEKKFGRGSVNRYFIILEDGTEYTSLRQARNHLNLSPDGSPGRTEMELSSESSKPPEDVSSSRPDTSATSGGSSAKKKAKKKGNNSASLRECLEELEMLATYVIERGGKRDLLEGWTAGRLTSGSWYFTSPKGRRFHSPAGVARELGVKAPASRRSTRGDGKTPLVVLPDPVALRVSGRKSRMVYPPKIYKGDPLQVILNLQTTSVKTQRGARNGVAFFQNLHKFTDKNYELIARRDPWDYALPPECLVYQGNGWVHVYLKGVVWSGSNGAKGVLGSYYGDDNFQHTVPGAVVSDPNAKEVDELIDGFAKQKEPLNRTQEQDNLLCKLVKFQVEARVSPDMAIDSGSQTTQTPPKKRGPPKKPDSDNDTVSEVGQTVLHPDHGQGVVTGFNMGWTNVRFSSGSESSQQSTPCRKKDLTLSLTPLSSSIHPVDDDDDATTSSSKTTTSGGELLTTSSSTANTSGGEHLTTSSSTTITSSREPVKIEEKGSRTVSRKGPSEGATVKVDKLGEAIMLLDNAFVTSVEYNVLKEDIINNQFERFEGVMKLMKYLNNEKINKEDYEDLKGALFASS